MTMNPLLNTAQEIAPVLVAEIDEEITSRRPSSRTLATLRENGFLRLFLPQSLGGLEVDPVTTAHLVEIVAGANAAAGWSMMVSNVSAWWCCLHSAKAVEDMYQSNPDARLAGAFHPPMQAVARDGGYVISGRSPLASNVSTAEWIFVTALVMENGGPKTTDGIPEVIGVYIPRDKCQVLDTWYTYGMQATDSNDVAVDQVFVPGTYLHQLRPGLAHNKYFTGPLYNFPAIGASIACLIAPIALATARNAIEEFKGLASKKVPFGSMIPVRDRGAVQRKLGVAEANVQSSRAYLYHTLQMCWDKVLNGVALTMHDKAALLLAATHTNQTCCAAVDLLYSAAGASAIYCKNKIGYHFVNAQVIRQHGFANDSRYETAAQVHLGLSPDLPVLAF
jgi:alkylation response protein AidB-like acyl-CoA dehydrogenase